MLISSWDRVEDVGLILKQCCANVSFLKKTLTGLLIKININIKAVSKYNNIIMLEAV